jgi:hypothetical protein
LSRRAWGAARVSIARFAARPEPIGQIPETLLVWRQGLEVNHRPVEADVGPLLSMVRAGARLDQLCERLIESVPEERATERAFQIVGRWLADGLIAAPG